MDWWIGGAHEIAICSVRFIWRGLVLEKGFGCGVVGRSRSTRVKEVGFTADWAMAQGTSLLAACGGETVKLFDVSIETGDPCTFQYTPSPGYQVNCVRWNHTSKFDAGFVQGVSRFIFYG